MGITSPAVYGPVSPAGATLGPVTATAQDQFGDPVAAPPGVSPSRSTRHPLMGGSRRRPAGPRPRHGGTPAGQSSVSFYYGDLQVGTPTITASAPGHPGFRPAGDAHAHASAGTDGGGCRRGNGSATVTWAPPPWDGGSPVTAYTVTSSPGGATCDWSERAALRARFRAHQRHALHLHRDGHQRRRPGTALGAVGAGHPGRGPRQPRRGSRRRPGEQRQVSWSPPVDRRCADQHLSGDLGPEWEDVFSWTVGPLACTVTGLTNGTSYTFDVVAHNAVGDSPASGPLQPGDADPSDVVPRVGAGRGFLDSRPGVRKVGATGRRGRTGTRRDVTVGRLAGVPPADADAVVLNVTVTDTTGSSFLTIWPRGRRSPRRRVELDAGTTIPGNTVTVEARHRRDDPIYNLTGTVT